MRTICSTVKGNPNVVSWGTTASFEARSRRRAVRTSTPSTRAEPSYRERIPERILMSVLLPDPLGPEQAHHLAGLHAERDVFQGGLPGIAEAHRLGLDPARPWSQVKS